MQCDENSALVLQLPPRAPSLSLILRKDGRVQEGVHTQKKFANMPQKLSKSSETSKV